MAYSGAWMGLTDPGPLYPRGSFQRLADALASCIEDNGGENLLGTRVVRDRARRRTRGGRGARRGRARIGRGNRLQRGRPRDLGQLLPADAMSERFARRLRACARRCRRCCCTPRSSWIRRPRDFRTSTSCTPTRTTRPSSTGCSRARSAGSGSACRRCTTLARARRRARGVPLEPDGIRHRRTVGGRQAALHGDDAGGRRAGAARLPRGAELPRPRHTGNLRALHARPPGRCIRVGEHAGPDRAETARQPHPGRGPVPGRALDAPGDGQHPLPALRGADGGGDRGPREPGRAARFAARAPAPSREAGRAWSSNAAPPCRCATASSCGADVIARRRPRGSPRCSGAPLRPLLLADAGVDPRARAGGGGRARAGVHGRARPARLRGRVPPLRQRGRRRPRLRRVGGGTGLVHGRGGDGRTLLRRRHPVARGGEASRPTCVRSRRS